MTDRYSHCDRCGAGWTMRDGYAHVCPVPTDSPVDPNVAIQPPMKGDPVTAPPAPRRHKTVAELVALLQTFPPETPIASLADEFGTFWDITPKMERLRWLPRWRTKPNEYDWVEAWLDEENNGTETFHVII